MKELPLQSAEHWTRLSSGSDKAVRPTSINCRCPHCDREVNFSAGNAVLAGLVCVWKTFCPSCRQPVRFIIVQKEGGTTSPTPATATQHCEALCIHPSPRPAEPKVPDGIAEVSPTFLEVYRQSLQAKDASLDQLYGMGLRKALEFLVKDFCIKNTSGAPDAIKRSFLGKCIKDHVDDPKLKTCAERAAWLGNDETHYVRKWTTRDIKDLEILLQLTLNWIENHLLTDKYGTEMQ